METRGVDHEKISRGCACSVRAGRMAGRVKGEGLSTLSSCSNRTPPGCLQSSLSSTLSSTLSLLCLYSVVDAPRGIFLAIASCGVAPATRPNRAVGVSPDPPVFRPFPLHFIVLIVIDCNQSVPFDLGSIGVTCRFICHALIRPGTLFFRQPFTVAHSIPQVFCML